MDIFCILRRRARSLSLSHDRDINLYSLIVFILSYTLRAPQFLGEALLSRLPINHIPDSIEVFSLPILVLQAASQIIDQHNRFHIRTSHTRKGIHSLISMLPRINPQQRLKLPHHRILIRICPYPHLPSLRILNQPSPPTPLNPRQFRIHHLLQALQPTIRLINGALQSPAWLSAPTLARWRQILPEQRVVDVAAAVEVDEGLQGDLLRGGGGRGEFFGGGVVGVYVGLVVVFVVEFHYAA